MSIIEGKISCAVIENILIWRHRSFNVYCGKTYKLMDVPYFHPHVLIYRRASCNCFCWKHVWIIGFIRY